MDDAIRVVLADDHCMVRHGFSALLGDTPDITVVGQADDGFAAADIVRNTRPDVAILDYSMPHCDGLAATELILGQTTEVAILIVTMHKNVHYLVKILEAGARGFVLKSDASKELIEAIRSVSRGVTYISRAAATELAAYTGRRARSGIDSLSKREFELMRYLGAGHSLQHCAEIMHLSRSAVSTYRSRLLGKLGIETSAALIRFAIDNDIVE